MKPTKKKARAVLPRITEGKIKQIRALQDPRRLENRLWKAYLEASVAPCDPWAYTLASRIESLRKTRTSNLSPAFKSALIRDEESWLGPEILKAAEDGKLAEVAKAMQMLPRDGDPLFLASRARVLRAYCDRLDAGGLPTVREVVRALEAIAHREHGPISASLIPDERTVRFILTDADLPIGKATRGRPLKK